MTAAASPAGAYLQPITVLPVPMSVTESDRDRQTTRLSVVVSSRSAPRVDSMAAGSRARAGRT